MDEQADGRIARSRIGRSQGFADRSDATPADDGISFVGLTTTNGDYPTVASAVYMLIPQGIDADDAEGASATFSNESPGDPSMVPAVNLGSQIPPQGTCVIASGAGGRTCFRFDG